jgi:hypothetical protein
MSYIEEDDDNKNKALAEYGGISILGDKEPRQTIIPAGNSEYTTSPLAYKRERNMHFVRRNTRDPEQLRAEAELAESAVRATKERLQGKRSEVEVLADEEAD